MSRKEEAVLGGGCFWCTEAIYSRVKGVLKIEPGYAGGHVPNPSYELVCTGTTGHAEVVRITFDPDIISYKDIVGIFWYAHNPTALNRQGNDIGTQYRSIILYNDESQRKIAEQSMKAASESGDFEEAFVTEVEALDIFYPAEEYHYDYFANNPAQPYCSAVIAPKVQHFLDVYKKKGC